jgi:prevent-host-death family protein
VKTINATEFKAKCLQLLDEVQRTGEDIVISKRGKAVARVVAEKESKPWLALRGTGAYMGDPFVPVIKESDMEALKP